VVCAVRFLPLQSSLQQRSYCARCYYARLTAHLCVTRNALRQQTKAAQFVKFNLVIFETLWLVVHLNPQTPTVLTNLRAAEVKFNVGQGSRGQPGYGRRDNSSESMCKTCGCGNPFDPASEFSAWGKGVVPQRLDTDDAHQLFDPATDTAVCFDMQGALLQQHQRPAPHGDAVLLEEDDVQHADSPAPRDVRCVLYTTHAMCRAVEQMWQFSVVILLSTVQPGIFLVSTYGLFINLCVTLCGGSLGAYLDATPRLRAVRVVSATRNFAIAAAALAMYLLIRESYNPSLRLPLLIAVHILGAIAGLGRCYSRSHLFSVGCKRLHVWHFISMQIL
jgi:Ferroportin1 (FPN1)